MLRRADGSVYSENTPSGDFDRESSFHGIYKVILVSVKYVDDKKNILGKTQAPEVMYDGIIVGGKEEGQQLSNIRDAIESTGEDDNFGERIYKVCSMPVTGTSAVPLSKQDGSVVYVAFINGNSGFPIIIGRAKNALDRAKTGADKSTGPVRRWQYNGIYFEIDKNGNLTLKRKGGSFDSVNGIFKAVADANNALVKITDNKITLSTAGGATLNLSQGKVALGANGTELLQQISDQLQKIITFLNAVDSTHTHIGNLGYDTAPPTQASDFTQLGSDLSTIKGKIDSIKGTI